MIMESKRYSGFDEKYEENIIKNFYCQKLLKKNYDQMI